MEKQPVSPPAKSKGQVCSELGTKGLSFGAKALMKDIGEEPRAAWHSL